MTEVRITKEDLAKLISTGKITISCTNCAHTISIKLSDIVYSESSEESGNEVTEVRCIKCGRPMSEYAWAVRRGLCIDCWTSGE